MRFTFTVWFIFFLVLSIAAMGCGVLLIYLVAFVIMFYLRFK